MAMYKNSRWAAAGLVACALMSGAVLAQQAKSPKQIQPAPSELVPPPAAAATKPAAVDTDESRGGWRSACLKDVKQFCRAASGGSAKRECLQAAGAKVSPACRASLDERDDLRKDARRVCRPDLAALCPEAVGGKDEIACLRQKVAQLTPACSEAVKVLAER